LLLALRRLLPLLLLLLLLLPLHLDSREAVGGEEQMAL